MNDDSETGLAPGLGKSALSPGVCISSLMGRSEDIEEGSGSDVKSLGTEMPSLGDCSSCEPLSDDADEVVEGGISCFSFEGSLYE